MKEAEEMTPTEESKEGAGYTGGPMLPIEQEVARGLRFAHVMLLDLEQQEKETVRLVEALNALLAARGITSAAEWAEILENPTQLSHDFPL